MAMASRFLRLSKRLPQQLRRLSTDNTKGSVLDLYDHTQQHLLDLGPQIHENLHRNGKTIFIIRNKHTKQTYTVVLVASIVTFVK